MLRSVFRSTVSIVVAAVGVFVCAQRGVASELSFWSMWNEPEPQAKALRTIMANYTKAHPGTTFKVVWNGRQNQTKLRSALQAGISVDFMDQDADQLVGGLQKEGLGYQLDGVLPASATTAFLPGVFDLDATDGKHYQVPYIYNTVNFWYSKDMMSQAGGSPPKTWADLVELCGKVKKSGKQALVIEGNGSDYNFLYFAHLIERTLGPGAVLDVMKDKSGAGWAQPAVLAAAKAERQLWDAGCISPDARAFQWPAGQQTIALGDSMAELVGSWLPTELQSTAGPDFSWGSFDFPAVDGGKGKITDLEAELLSMMVLKNSAHKDEVISFLDYLMSPEAQKILVEEGGVGVTRKGVEWPAVLSGASASASNATDVSAWGGGLSIAYPDFHTTVILPEHNKMFLGQTTPEQFVETMVEKTKEYWKSH
jgi:ABC-type glycerol-3-phosphate transport system substrate-binding protein